MTGYSLSPSHMWRQSFHGSPSLSLVGAVLGTAGECSSRTEMQTCREYSSCLRSSGLVGQSLISCSLWSPRWPVSERRIHRSSLIHFLRIYYGVCYILAAERPNMSQVTYFLDPVGLIAGKQKKKIETGKWFCGKVPMCKHTDVSAIPSIHVKARHGEHL